MMEWKAPSERTQMILLSPIIIPCAAFLLTVLLPIAGLQWLYSRYGPPRFEWRRWFAWRPVCCDGFYYDQEDTWVWMAYVERKGGIFDDCDYRLPKWVKEQPHD